MEKLPQEGILRSSVILFVATLSSKILGLLREILIARFFGAGIFADSFLVATVLPYTLAGLVGGAFTTVFIPLFIEERQRSGEERAWEGAKTTLLVVGMVLSSLGIFAFWLSPPFIRLIAPGFEGERLRLAILMNRIMLPALFLLGMGGVMTGIFQTLRHFSFPAWAGLGFNAIVIPLLFLWQKRPIWALAGGALLGLVFQVATLSIFLILSTPLFRAPTRWWHPLLSRIWLLVLPIFVGASVGYLNLIVDRVFASLLPLGTIAAMNFAQRVRDIPESLFATSLTQAIYPSASERACEKDFSRLRSILSLSLESVWLFAFPVALFFFLLPQETVRFFFERGAFTSGDTLITAQILSMYALGIVAGESSGALGRIFYALQDTKTPVKLGVLAILLNILLNALLIRPLAHRGLALATSLSGIFLSFLLFISLRKRLQGIGGRELIKNLGKIMSASALLGILLFFLRPWAGNLGGYFLCISLGGALYGGLTLLFRVRSASILWQRGKGAALRYFRRERRRK